MTEQAPINLLKDGEIQEWNEWKCQQENKKLDLSNVDLSGINLTGADLTYTNLTGANLSHTDLTMVNLTQATLTDINLTDAQNIKDVVIYYEGNTDFKNACALLFKIGQETIAFRFYDQGYDDEFDEGLEGVIFENFRQYREDNIGLSSGDEEFLGVYLLDLETLSELVVINRGIVKEDKYGGWSFRYQRTEAEYNGKEISSRSLNYNYGGEHHPDQSKMKEFLKEFKRLEKEIKEKGMRDLRTDIRSVNYERNLQGQDFSYAYLGAVDFDEAHCENANFESSNLKGACLSGYFNGANFKGANLQNTEITGADNANFTDADLRGIITLQARGANFTKANLSDTRIRDGIFDVAGADFTNANLRGLALKQCECDCSNANFSGADLGGFSCEYADFSNANLTNANLTGANLSGVDLTEANLKGANLTEANLKGANLEGIITDENTKIEIPEKQEKINGADFRNANLSGADFSNVDLSGADFSNADIGDADFSNADLSGANLSIACFGGADFRNANLKGANLREVYVADANFINANLSGANLMGAYLMGADLEGANLKGANLSGADLSDAHLEGANFSGADLSGVDLTGVDLTDANLDGIITEKQEEEWEEEEENIVENSESATEESRNPINNLADTDKTIEELLSEGYQGVDYEFIKKKDAFVATANHFADKIKWVKTSPDAHGNVGLMTLDIQAFDELLEFMLEKFDSCPAQYSNKPEEEIYIFTPENELEETAIELTTEGEYGWKGSLYCLAHVEKYKDKIGLIFATKPEDSEEQDWLLVQIDQKNNQSSWSVHDGSLDQVYYIWAEEINIPEPNYNPTPEQISEIF